MKFTYENKRSAFEIMKFVASDELEKAKSAFEKLEINDQANVWTILTAPETGLPLEITKVVHKLLGNTACHAILGLKKTKQTQV